jgi:hypothetical protein
MSTQSSLHAAQHKTLIRPTALNVTTFFLCSVRPADSKAPRPPNSTSSLSLVSKRFYPFQVVESGLRRAIGEGRYGGAVTRLHADANLNDE